MWRYLIIGVLLAPAQASADECLSPATKYDICAKAKEMQSEIAKALPMRLNQNMVWQSVVVAGPRLTASVVWEQTMSELESMLRNAGMVKSDLLAKLQTSTQSMVCSKSVMAAFVRLGGQVEYQYSTKDFVAVGGALVDSCQR